MTGESEECCCIQPDPDHPQIVNGSFEIDENEDGKPDGWHYQRQTSMCEDAPMDGKYCIRFENKDPALISQGLQGSAINGRAIRPFSQLGLLGALQRNRAELRLRSKQRLSFISMTIFVAKLVQRYSENGVAASGWQNAKSTVVVPPNARELIIRIGLNSAQGQLDLDDMQMIAVRRD